MIREIARIVGDFLAGDPRSLPDMAREMDEKLRRIIAFADEETAIILRDLQDEFSTEVDSHDFTIVGDEMRGLIANSKIDKSNLDNQTKARFKEKISDSTLKVIDSHFITYMMVPNVQPIEIGPDAYFEYLVAAREVARTAFKLYDLKIPPEYYPHHTTISLGLLRMHAIRSGE